MNSEPSADSVSQLLELGLAANRSEAVQQLMRNGNDLHRTIDSIFDVNSLPTNDQRPAENDWREEDFHTDRNDTQQPDGAQNSFTINSPDVLRPAIFAPSRPPSPNPQVYDLTKEHGNADPQKSLSADEIHESDMQRAIKLSMSDLKPQEHGVTQESGQRFGPANRLHYDPSSWALTTQSEVILHPEPIDRKLEVHQPATLRPEKSAPYLAPLLTILHSIPVAKEALFLRQRVLPDYGHNPEWWSGSSVSIDRIVQLGENNDDALAEEEVVTETQRLMAFLDKTTRSYGSVDPLVATKALDGVKEEEVVSSFLGTWQSGARRHLPSSDLQDVFEFVGVKISQAGAELGRSNPSLLELRLDNVITRSQLSLYEAMDEHIWEGSPDDEDCAVYLERVGEIFTVFVSSLNASSPARGISIPAVWYADRYLKQNQQRAKKMRTEKSQAQRNLATIAERQKLLSSCSLPGRSSPVASTRLLKSTIAQLETLNMAKSLDAPLSGSDGQRDTDRGINDEDVIEKLSIISDRVASKLQDLEDARTKELADLADISALLTRESDDAESTPIHPYILRGVITDPDITYTLRKLDAEEMETEEVALKGHQWWKIAYSSSDPKLFTKTKISQQEVLEAARDEGRHALLVYARRESDVTQPEPLPPALERFVDADNQAFAAEFSSGILTPPSQHSETSPQHGPVVIEGEDVRWGGDTPPPPSYAVNDPVGTVDPANLTTTTTPSAQGHDESMAVNQEMEEKRGAGGLIAASMRRGASRTSRASTASPSPDGDGVDSVMRDVDITKAD
ncbi:MAG: hypothetical protein M1825_001052 [Sarcosagium campestre]|nr:MAG: hypothetical protein M1825_001052 [Sarcosagium campestre]